MKERATVQTSIYMTERMHERIKATAKRFNVSISEIVRECIQSDLPKLIDRESKRRNYHKDKAEN